MSVHLDDGIVREVIKKHNEIEEQERRQAMEEVVDRWNAKQRGEEPPGPEEDPEEKKEREQATKITQAMVAELPDAKY